MQIEMYPRKAIHNICNVLFLFLVCSVFSISYRFNFYLFDVYLTTLSAVKTFQYWMESLLPNNDFQRVQKYVVVVSLRKCSG